MDRSITKYTSETEAEEMRNWNWKKEHKLDKASGQLVDDALRSRKAMTGKSVNGQKL